MHEQASPKSYQKKFSVIAIRQLPHHVLLATSVKLNAHYVAKLLSKHPEKQLKKCVLKEYDSKQTTQYVDAVKDTKLWHGTGKFQYKNGKATDIFTAIVEQGSLAPAHDVYSVLINGDEMISISTTTLRIIARAYADTHGKGEHESNRYGTALWWVAYYYSLFYGALYTRHSVTIIRNWEKWAKAASQDGVIAWGKKVNSHAEYVWDVFGSGSDIPGNYPIIFGIAHHGQTAVLPKVLERAEVRITQPVPMAHISHIEVPQAKITEATALLKQHGYTTPVFPIELGEYVTSRQKFTDILEIS